MNTTEQQKSIQKLNNVGCASPRLCARHMVLNIAAVATDFWEHLSNESLP